MRMQFATVRIRFVAAEYFRRCRNYLNEFARVRPTAAAPQLPAPLTAADQWMRVASVLFEAKSRTERAVETHWAASAQLDAATYALQRLREDIAPALVLTTPRAAPAVPSALRREPFRRSEPLAA
jgi:hypothetical protein